MIPADDPGRWEWIENYIDGKLTLPERQEMEAELATNPAFREEVEYVKRAWKLVRDARTGIVVRETLVSLRREKRTMPLSRPRWRVLIPGGVVAASVMFLVFLMISPVRLPKSEYDSSVLRSLDPIELDGTERKVYEAFFGGQARLAEGKYSQAVALFKGVTAARGLRPYFTEAAEWHLCVALFHAGRYNEAGKLLEKVNSREKPAYGVQRWERWKMWVQIQLRS
ncbi:MAG: hypothetical protein ACO1N1_17510 [Dyadobacter fermentans]